MGKTWYVDGVTIIEVPFCGLKGIGKKTTKILHKAQPVSKLCNWICELKTHPVCTATVQSSELKIGL